MQLYLTIRNIVVLQLCLLPSMINFEGVVIYSKVCIMFFFLVNFFVAFACTFILIAQLAVVIV